MIRPLGLSDLPRQLLPGRLAGVDLAYTRATMTGRSRELTNVDLVRWTTASSKLQCPLALVRGGRLEALALLRTRRGPRAWEVARLFASHRGLRMVDELLDGCVAHVGAHGGERLFLRVPDGSAVQDIAQQAGFVAGFTEDVFRRNRPVVPGAEGPSLGLRPALPGDDHGLFRLYCAGQPGNVRAASGVTLDQWLDARERTNGASREYVWEDKTAIRGWLRLEHAGDRMTVEAMPHPDEAAYAPLMIGDVALLAWGHARAAWIVPSYSSPMAEALQGVGWNLSETYAVLVRPVARTAREPNLAAVRA